MNINNIDVSKLKELRLQVDSKIKELERQGIPEEETKEIKALVEDINSIRGFGQNRGNAEITLDMKVKVEYFIEIEDVKAQAVLDTYDTITDIEKSLAKTVKNDVKKADALHKKIVAKTQALAKKYNLDEYDLYERFMEGEI